MFDLSAVLISRMGFGVSTSPHSVGACPLPHPVPTVSGHLGGRGAGERGGERDRGQQELKVYDSFSHSLFPLLWQAQLTGAALPPGDCAVTKTLLTLRVS